MHGDSDGILLEGVTKDFDGWGAPEPVHVLRGVTLCIPRGSRVGVGGAAGSGKTTLLRILGGWESPTEGLVLLDGRNLADLGEAERVAYRAQHVGFVPQHAVLVPQLTVQGNVELPMVAQRIPKELRVARARELLQAVGMLRFANGSPRYLVPEERQRVAIARALANRPSLVLADEPTEGLALAASASLTQLLLRLSRESGSTVVLASRSESIVDQCDVQLRIREGRIIHDASGEDGVRERDLWPRASAIDAVSASRHPS